MFVYIPMIFHNEKTHFIVVIAIGNYIYTKDITLVIRKFIENQ